MQNFKKTMKAQQCIHLNRNILKFVITTSIISVISLILSIPIRDEHVSIIILYVGLCFLSLTIMGALGLCLVSCCITHCVESENLEYYQVQELELQKIEVI